MANAPQESGFYFAQQFNFNNVDEVGYCGVQPRAASDGNSIVHGVFSSFQNGTTTDNPNCSNGADVADDDRTKLKGPVTALAEDLSTLRGTLGID